MHQYFRFVVFVWLIYIDINIFASNIFHRLSLNVENFKSSAMRWTNTRPIVSVCTWNVLIACHWHEKRHISDVSFFSRVCFDHVHQIAIVKKIFFFVEKERVQILQKYRYVLKYENKKFFTNQWTFNWLTFIAVI